MNLIKSLLASTALLLAVPHIAQAEILVGFVTGLSGPVSSIGIPNANSMMTLPARSLRKRLIRGRSVRTIFAYSKKPGVIGRLERTRVMRQAMMQFTPR